MHEVVLTQDVPARNPEFSQAAHIDAIREGRTYDVPHTIILPAGTQLKHPRAHYLVRPGYKNAEPLAVPCCEATAERLKHYQKTQRQAGLRLLSAAVVALPKDPAAVKHVLELAEKYSVMPESKAKVEQLRKEAEQRLGNRRKPKPE